MTFVSYSSKVFQEIKYRIWDLMSKQENETLMTESYDWLDDP